MTDPDELRRELDKRVTELDGVMQCMLEGVILIAKEGHIRRLNRAAGALLGVDANSARGQDLDEAVRDDAFRGIIRKALAASGEVDTRVTVRVEEGVERHLHVKSRPLRTAQGISRGIILILEDQTQLRNLERIRRDFVANVSHELKTPITSIKGYLETLRDGALDDSENAARFVEIALKQADRLDAIIEDLLSLSRIEQDDERGGIALERGSVREVLEEAVQTCGPRAQSQGVSLEMKCDAKLTAPLNVSLLEQAIVNLVDNAVKYSDAGETVRIVAMTDRSEIAISVIDRGPGIDREHLDRIFERFYRVDKARSRKMGGTGLGLAIVKHIAQAHGGSISVESEKGRGSAFTIRLPV